MDGGSSQARSVQKVRTFFSDAKHATGSGGKVAPPPQAAPAAPSQPMGVVPEVVPKAPRPLGEESLAHTPLGSHTTKSHLSDHDNVFDIRGASEGTQEGVIVKDMVRKRWSLGKEIEKSVSGWVKEKAESLTTDTSPTVAPAALRANVITTAGAKSHLAPRDDSKVVVSKLRTFAKDAEKATGKPFVFDTNIPEEAPQWTSLSDKTESRPEAAKERPVEQYAQNLLRSLKQPRPVRTIGLKNRENVIAKSPEMSVAPQAAQTLPESVFTERIAAREERLRPAPEPVTREAVIATNVESAVAEEAPQRVAPTRTVEAPQIPRAEPPAPAPTPSREINFTLPTFSKTETTSLRTMRADALSDVEEKKISIAHIASAEAKKRAARGDDIDLRPHVSRMPFVLATLGVLLFVGAGFGLYALFGVPRDEAPLEVVTIPSFVQTASQRPLPLPNSREALLTELANLTTSAPPPGRSLAQYYPTVTENGATIPAPTGMIMDVLDIRAPGSFIRSLGDGMMLGAYGGEGPQPFMILKPRQFDVAYAGMLEWEPSISSDLAPLFGEPVRRTLDPTARTNDQTRTARFVDDSIRNRDVRILYNELGEERMLYSFVDPGTIVITTSAEAFIGIIEALR